MRREAEIGVTCQGMPKIANSNQKLSERHGAGSPSGTNPVNTLILDFLAYRLRINFCCFTPLSLWYFVTAALEGPCSGYIPRCRMYWDGQNIYSGFSKTSYGKIRTNFFANLIQFCHLLTKAASILESVQKLKLRV